MSQSGVFQLILRDERYDAFFTASDYLRRRMKGIREKRAAEGLANVQPTFADIERSHVMFLRAIYRPFVAVASQYVRVKPSGDGSTLTAAGGRVEFTFPTYGHFTSDMVFHVRFADVGTANPIISPAAPASPRYRFCAYPGIRLFERVIYTSDEVVIDDYVRDEVVMFDKFAVGTDRRPGWDRGMGQQELRTGEFFNSNGFTGCIQYKEGLQTLKFLQPSEDLWVPAQFWSCQDASHALLNDLVPNTQRKVAVDLAPLNLIIQQRGQVSGDVEPLSFDRARLDIDLYVNNIFTNPEVHQIFASRVGFSLIRVHRRQQASLSLAQSNVHLSQLKYPAEYLWMGVRDRANAANFDHWHLFGRRRVRTDATALLQPASIWNSTLSICQLVCRSATETSTLDPIIDSVKLTAHGIDLFPQLPASFFTNYLPQRYFHGTAIVTPRDTSVLHFAFCLYPGQHNPSGYYNLSAGRELYLSYDSGSKISIDTPADMFLTISALNFLVRKGDRISLRYSM